mgnify:CR=1 FL=1
MVKFRSFFAVLLALVMVLMLNVGSVEAAKKVKKPQTYTSEQIETIRDYATDLKAMRDRLPELAPLITKKDWTYTRNFIHGPLGELRVQMLNLSRYLLPDAQPSAQKLAKDVFDDLVALDLAAQNSNYQLALKQYSATLKDFDAFYGLIPPAALPKPEPVAAKSSSDSSQAAAKSADFATLDKILDALEQ